VRLIRSKGVGVYFVSQNPLDIPDQVLGQLGNRIQHALRAFTPRDQKAVRAAAETFRANPGLDVEAAITALGVGEALVSLLDEKGRPYPVERALIAPPHSQLGPITPEQRQAIVKQSVLYGHYEQVVDRESAYEKLKGRAEQAEKNAAPTAPEQTESPVAEGGGWLGGLGEMLGGGGGRGNRQGVAEAAIKSAARAIGSQLGRQIIRGVLGSIMGGKR
jgi:DNA helicase HerA-like ATPase